MMKAMAVSARCILQFVLENKSTFEQNAFQGLTFVPGFEALLFVHVLSVVSSQAKRRLWM